MAYFNSYYTDLKSLSDKVANDIKSDDKKDYRLTASLVHFKKEVDQLMHIAANNFYIENEDSLMPEGVETAGQPQSNG